MNQNWKLTSASFSRCSCTTSTWKPFFIPPAPWWWSWFSNWYKLNNVQWTSKLAFFSDISSTYGFVISIAFELVFCLLLEKKRNTYKQRCLLAYYGCQFYIKNVLLLPGPFGLALPPIKACSGLSTSSSQCQRCRPSRCWQERTWGTIMSILGAQ